MNRWGGQCACRSPASGGSALVVVLWVVGLLSMLVAAFAFDAHIEARITSYYRKRKKAEYLSASGIEIARLLMVKSAELDPGATGSVEEEDEWWYEDALRLAQGLAIRGMTHELGEGVITLDIVPEPARRNINRLGSSDAEKEANLERILDVAGVPWEMWPELIESFLDWTDKDDDARFDGAETEDYYATLDPPYQAKNGALDTVGELLLVKGFSRSILFGGVISTGAQGEAVMVSGIEDMLTTYGDKKGRINVNAASERVLMTLPEVDDLAAGAILEEREGWVNEYGVVEDQYFENVNDLFRRIPELDRTAIEPYITTDSTIYRVTSAGTVGGVSRRVWCIGESAGEQFTIWRWREEE